MPAHFFWSTSITQITDDMDGSSDAVTIEFSYKGIEYTIDLAQKNEAKFDKALGPFIAAAAKVGGGRKTRGASSKDSPRKNLAGVREWARANGYEISERGRVPAAVLEAYDAR